MSARARRRSTQNPTLLIVVLVSLMVSIVVCVLGAWYQPRTTAAAAPRIASNPLLGIDLPVGATLDRLPAGLRDYIRKTWPGLLPELPTTNPALGIDRPAGAGPADLPAGVTDYLREQMPQRTP